MFMEERHQEILKMLENNNRVEVQALSQIFNVSEDTIRRDLRIMEQRGQVHRTYGGAIIPEKTIINKDFHIREGINSDIKHEIAEKASAFIQEGDTLLLDGSTTVAKLVPFLSKFKDITVITNSIFIANNIINLCPKVKLFITGGLIRTDIANVVSHEAIEYIKKLYVDKVFIGACTISSKGEITTAVIEEAEIKKIMLEAGREIYIMADSSKFSQKTVAWCGRIKPEYVIVTDSSLGSEVKKDLGGLIKKGLKIVTE